jgi:hypothetical protein
MAPSTHDIARVAAGIRTAAAEAGVTLPVEFTRALAADGLAREPALAVTRLGVGVVIHTRPDTTRRLPILLGYADGRGQWYRDGRRHQPTTAPTAGIGAKPGVAL